MELTRHLLLNRNRVLGNISSAALGARSRPPVPVDEIRGDACAAGCLVGSRCRCRMESGGEAVGERAPSQLHRVTLDAPTRPVRGGDGPRRRGIRLRRGRLCRSRVKKAAACTLPLLGTAAPRGHRARGGRHRRLQGAAAVAVGEEQPRDELAAGPGQAAHAAPGQQQRLRVGDEGEHGREYHRKKGGEEGDEEKEAPADLLVGAAAPAPPRRLGRQRHGHEKGGEEGDEERLAPADLQVWGGGGASAPASRLGRRRHGHRPYSRSASFFASSSCRGVKGGRGRAPLVAAVCRKGEGQFCLFACDGVGDLTERAHGTNRRPSKKVSFRGHIDNFEKKKGPNN